MTDLTARELINTILRSLAETRATFKKAATNGDRPTLQPDSNGDRSADQAADLERR
jgi:hypothetical protein